uniref:Uncharacterized protein n=1 Tax=Plectus sambesii TaxID=2011161 RepID=A0A914XLS4_9BILA
MKGVIRYLIVLTGQMDEAYGTKTNGAEAEGATTNGATDAEQGRLSADGACDWTVTSDAFYAEFCDYHLQALLSSKTPRKIVPLSYQTPRERCWPHGVST